MLTAFTRAFKTPDLRRKLLFTLFIIVVFRLGSVVPPPGVSYRAVQSCLKNADQSSGVLGLANLFTQPPVDWAAILAAAVLATLPVMLLFRVLERYLVATDVRVGIR